MAACVAASFGRLSLAAPKGKAAAPVRLAARSSTAFAAGAVALRKSAPVALKATRLAAAPIVARHMPGKNGLKTRKAAAKRYKITAGGKVIRRHAYKGHLLAHKSSKRKRFLSSSAVVEKADIKNVKECLPYARIK